MHSCRKNIFCNLSYHILIGLLLTPNFQQALFEDVSINNMLFDEKMTLLTMTFLVTLLYGYWKNLVLGSNDLSGLARPKQQRMKRIIVWTSYYMVSFPLSKRRNVNLKCAFPCTLHNNKDNPLLYDAILFHARDEQHPPMVRHPDQVYVIFVLESPSYPGPYIRGDFYNWSATYDPRSEVWTPYLSFEKKKDIGDHITLISTFLPQMTYNRSSNEAMIAWVVTHCRTEGKREMYVKSLRRFINIDIFGHCGKRCYKGKKENGAACQKKLAETGVYKFYLSFENSACHNYITEKVYHSLNTGLVPIVYGGLHHEDYDNLLPPHSFIDVRDFQSPKHLAKYLFYLNVNDTAYIEYHEWRRTFVMHRYSHTDLLCRVCDGLYNQTLMTQRTINFGRLWHRERECDENFFYKVT